MLFIVDSLEIKTNIQGEFLCPNCQRPYRHKSSVYTHMKNDCGKVPQFHCETCDSNFKYEHVLKRHKLSLSHQKKFQAFESLKLIDYNLISK